MTTETDKHKLRGKVIAFEGVDGAGKSTVLKLVMDHLEARGLALATPRVGKEHKSKPIREIRRLTRDRTNLDICPRTELLLYAAREAQVLDQTVKPAVARGATVLLDRSMLTPVVLGAYGRGLDLASCEAIAAEASAGLEPDLTLVFDVDPRTSRVRKRLDKIATRRQRDGGRKGLAGSGFKQRIREGYLELARRDGLPVIHAERASPAEVADRVIRLLETGELDETPDDARPWFEVEPGRTFEAALAELPELVALYFSRRIPLGRELRARLFETQPELAVWAADLADPLLELAWDRAPELAIGRLAGSPRASELDARRSALAADYPSEVARSLSQVEGPAADELRTRLAASAPGAVVESLAGRQDSFAASLRERLWKRADAYERAKSLRGCDDAEGWRRRERLLAKDPAVALSSLVGLRGERVDAALRRFAGKAPKSVISALVGRSDDFAHGLRRELLDTGREVVDSIIGLDDEQSWQLRDRCAERWPSTVVHSLEGVEDHARSTELVARCRALAPNDLFLLRREYRIREDLSLR